MIDLGILWAVVDLHAVPYMPRYPNRAETPHLTLAWGVPRAKYARAEGSNPWIRLDAECWSDRLQAIRCQLREGIPFEGKIPHITLSWVDGAKPVESAEMLTREHRSRPIGVSVPGRIEWVPLQDSAVAWRIKSLEAIEANGSVNKAAQSLGIGASTMRGWFKKLGEDHPDRVAYERLAISKGGWQKGRSRLIK
jgi:hypothetical protein